MGVGENIVRLRKLTGVTQEELADIAGVTRAAVSLWEIGKSEPRMGAVQSMADYFGIRKANIIEDGGMDQVAVSPTGRLYSFEFTSEALAPDEQRLVDLYRSCTPQGRRFMLEVAESVTTTFATDKKQGSD